MSISSQNSKEVRNKTDEPGNTVPQGSKHSRGFTNRIRFPIDNVPSSKTRWKNSPNYQSKRAKQLSSAKKISITKPLQSASLFTTGGLPVKNRHIPGVFSCAGKISTQKISNNCSSGPHSTVHMPTIWPLHGTPNVRKTDKLGSFAPPKNEHKSNSISRRFSTSLPGPRKTPRRCHKNNQILNQSRLDNKPRKIFKRAISVLGVSGNRLEHLKADNVSPTQENRINKKGLEQNSNKSKLVMDLRKKFAGKVKFRLLRDPAWKATLPGTAASRQYLARESEKENVPHNNKSSSGMCLVATKSRAKRNSPKVSRDGSYHIRRVRPGLGSTSRPEIDQRTVECLSDPVAHQQKRAICSHTSFSVRNELTKKQESHSTIRQSDSDCLHQKTRRNSFSTVNDASFAAARNGSVSSSGDMPTVYSRNVQRYCRQPIPAEESCGLASFKTDHQSDILQMGNSRNRSVCDKHVEGGPSLCRSEREGQRSPVHRCFLQDMGVQVSLDISTPIPSTSSFVSLERGQRNLHPNSPTMEESVLEVRSKNEGNGSPIPDPQSPASPYRYDDRPSATESQQSAFGGMEGTGWSNITLGWSTEDREFLEKSWRSSTLKTYSAPWKTWVERCKSLGLDPSNPDASSVAQHLSFLFRTKKLSSSTVKLHKSVIATFANPMAREKISNNALVRQMIKAIELAEPPPPIKKQIWDIKQLIRWMENTSIHEDSLFQVSRQLALILLLASGRRVHDLTLLNIDNTGMLLLDTSVTFWPNFGSKTDNKRHRQSAWQLSAIPNEKLDPIRWVRLYLSLSETRRSSGDRYINSLFITSRGRVKCASRAVIAGWIKTALLELNINFPPGSIRSAVASSRRDNNVPIDSILKNGNWRSERNVFKHYFKEIINSPRTDDSVANLVISSFNTL